MISMHISMNDIKDIKFELKVFQVTRESVD
jgi:hypothetical protein